MEGGVCIGGEGGLHPGDLHPEESASMGSASGQSASREDRVCIQGGSASRGVGQTLRSTYRGSLHREGEGGQTPSEIRRILWIWSTSGRYASYWNAFLY